MASSPTGGRARQARPRRNPTASPYPDGGLPSSSGSDHHGSATNLKQDSGGGLPPRWPGSSSLSMARRRLQQVLSNLVRSQPPTACNTDSDDVQFAVRMLSRICHWRLSKS
ncbi:uncharacterized protein LOC119268295 [Triticum dicoccoides]|uniref:uncharacterized protein LOC119268295 n=1 Tax=Triticum dicoccoides TaxID=85692 RepID=UPI00188FD933|nr:uncharacterized protein LOC119268295 [Triticum dicoccoides]